MSACMASMCSSLHCSLSSKSSSPPPSPPKSPQSLKPHITNLRRALPFRALLAISTVAAAIFLKRKKGLQKVKGSAFMSTYIHPSPKVIDTHLHVWAPPHQTEKYPYFPGQEPTIAGNAELLLQEMENSGVDGALIVQPINHKFDHSYVSSVLQEYPGKFVGCCLADPTEGGGGLLEFERLVVEEGYRAVRFNPYLWPSGEKMTNIVGKALFQKAGELGVPVGFMCFKGLLLHIAEIEELCSDFPETTVLIDHFGFCRPPLSAVEIEAWSRLLQLSKYPKVYVKMSAFFRISREKFPYKDTWKLVKDLLNAYGARRLLWGSDFPYVVEDCGYLNAKNVLPTIYRQEGFISNEDLDWIMGGNALELFNAVWK